MIFVVIFILIAAFVVVVMLTNDPCLAQVTTCVYGKLKGNGVIVQNHDQLVSLIVIVVLAIAIALIVTYIRDRYYSQAYIVAKYNRQSKAIYDQYMAVQKARLDKIARMFYHFD